MEVLSVSQTRHAATSGGQMEKVQCDNGLNAQGTPWNINHQFALKFTQMQSVQSVITEATVLKH